MASGRHRCVSDAPTLSLTLPLFKRLFKVETIGFDWEWLMIVVLASVPVSVIEIAKLLRAPPRDRWGLISM